MKRRILLIGLACLAVTGCQTPNQTNGAIGGGIIGGIIGTGVGIATRNPAAGMAIGAGTGALVGTAVGANKDTQQAKAAQAQANAYAKANPPMTITDVVALSRQGVADSIIIQQMASTNSYYNLRPEDLGYLSQEQVHQSVILWMQQHPTPRPVYVAPPPVYGYGPPPVVYGPPPVGFGVGVAVPIR